MRDPSYPCKKRIKEGVWWRSLRFSCPLERETFRIHHPAALQLGGIGRARRGELAKARHRRGDSLPLDFCRDAARLIIFSFVFEKSRCLSCRSGRVKRLERFAASALLLLNGVQVNVQLKPRCNQSARCHFPIVYWGQKAQELVSVNKMTKLDFSGGKPVGSQIPPRLVGPWGWRRGPAPRFQPPSPLPSLVP